jgi:hypothetical protein
MRPAIVFALLLALARPAAAEPLDAIAADRLRIQTHLSLVERELRAKPVDHLSIELRNARAHNLDLLHAYWVAGNFPHNTRRAERTPIFIDDDGRACAVGALVLASDPTLARAVARDEDEARLADMKTPGLNEWIAKSGLTFDECAWIQPSYCTDGCPGSSDYVCGMDGRTYRNACVAVQCGGVGVAYEGVCVDGGAPEAGPPVDVGPGDVADSAIADTTADVEDATVIDTATADTATADTAVADTAVADTRVDDPQIVARATGSGCATAPGAVDGAVWLLVAALLLRPRRS